jgi:integrase
MGLLLECPSCKTRNSPKNRACKCGSALNRLSGRVWWIEWYQDGQRKRERIGPNKTAAEQRLREVQSAKVEGRYIHKSPDCHTRFEELAKWYLTLDKAKAKKSYDRDKRSVGKLCAFLGNHLLRDITPAMVEKYIHIRLAEPSYRGHLTKPATVVRELACLNHIYTNAMRNGKAEWNPVQGVKRPPENNERDRVLTREEHNRLITECPPYIGPVIELAYYTGMRRGEIINLTWDKVDLKEGIIRLSPEDTKTNQGRDIPLCPELIEMFRAMPQGLPGVPVFTRKGKPITGSTIRVGLEIACKRAEIEGFTFHDFRHTFNTNAYRVGVPIPTIMKITGHKSLTMFKRYTTINREDLRAAVEKIGSHGHQYGHQDTFNTQWSSVRNG